ncbi:MULTISPECIES: hypothetical protein [unclassified Pseudomonas]|uniref:hypothetical protein n=1 Tax=unclassified Pseudomonas TaxID=196821 RepID=UPI002456D0F4|nr:MULTISPECIES: hypothetical protein [unclassified Pseudomonas]MDH4560087.1 hypothetical protein [Pseudomonas sp. BN411]MDH4871301.1 hypothetical protein [Pseudomonas sp. BN515]
MASDSAQASPRTRGEKLVTCGWLALAVAIPVSCIFSSEPFDFSASLAALSLITLCAAFACWPKLFIAPIDYKHLCDTVPRKSQIAMSLFVGLTVLRGFVELMA